MDGFFAPTPDYKLEETPTDVILTVCAPLCRSNRVSVFFENKFITIESHPYFLRLKLPCKVVTSTTGEHFDEKTGTYTLTLKKLLNNEEETDSENEDDSLSDVNTSSNIENQETNESVKEMTDHTNTHNKYPSYGFLHKYSQVFKISSYDYGDFIDLPDPDNTKQEDRVKFKLEHEKKKWDEDYYIADFMEKDQIDPLLKHVMPWLSTQEYELTEEEIGILDQIPVDNWSMSALTEKEIQFGECQLIDILLAYCYNERTTESENTVESWWTINKLSSTLSWLDTPASLKGVVLSFYRRSLTYPLYRNWDLTVKIHHDLCYLFALGNEMVTRCLIKVRNIFSDVKDGELLNFLFIDQLCHFARSLTPLRLDELAADISKIRIDKCEVNEDIHVVELAAKITLEEERRAQELVSELKKQAEEESESEEEVAVPEKKESSEEFEDDDDDETEVIIVGKDEEAGVEVMTMKEIKKEKKIDPGELIRNFIHSLDGLKLGDKTVNLSNGS